MIKVLQIGLTNNKGGIESFVLNYYKVLSEKNVIFDFVKSYDVLQYEKEFKENGSEIYKTCSFNSNPIKYFFQLYQIIKYNDYHIVHYNMNSCANIIPLLAGKLAKCDMIIAHAHNSANDKGLMKELLHCFNRFFIKQLANVYLSCSDKASDWFYMKNIPREKIIKIPNSIEYDKYQYNATIRNQYRKIYNLEDKFIIGHVGRFNKQKNHIFMIKLLEDIIKIEDNAILVFVGDGPELANIKEQIKKKGLQDYIIILRDRDDVALLYQMFDVFILPSLYEGLPLVGIEAQIAGLPCVFSDNITKELIINQNVKYISLSRYEEWIQEIISAKKTSRTYIITDHTYDINFNVNLLQDIYGSLSKKI